MQYTEITTLINSMTNTSYKRAVVIQRFIARTSADGGGSDAERLSGSAKENLAAHATPQHRKPSE